MHAHELIVTRRTVHDYAPTDVDEAIVDRALVAAHHAPCHKHTWPWRFIKVGRQTREAMVPTAVALKSAGRSTPLPDKAKQKIVEKLVNPAWLVVVTQVRADDAFRRQEDYAACATAIQNLQLALHAEGLGTKWSSGSLTRHPDLLALLGVDPETEDLVGYVWVGHAAGPARVIKRPPLDERFVRTLP